MAIYRVYPEYDSFITSEFQTSNTGLDQILEIGGYRDLSGVGSTSRSLVRFSLNEITDVIDNKLNNSPVSASLNYYLANANAIPVSFSLEAFPLAQEWDNGKGTYGDKPVDTSGVSWKYTKAGESTSWLTSGFPTNVTASFSSSLTEGGGSWYTGSNGINVRGSQTFTLYDNPDLRIDVSNAVEEIYSGSLPNYGFIVKLDDSLEFNTTTDIKLKYFSKDTNSIYLPYLEFKWDDSIYNTGSLAVLTTDICTIGINNNKGTYRNTEKIRFRISSKPKYPARTFTTSSIYLTNYALPENSYWGIKDEFSEEMVIDFDTTFTKLNCDTNGSYFDLYLNSLQPERYYRILIKTVLDNSELVFDDKNLFKVIRNG